MKTINQLMLAGMMLLAAVNGNAQTGQTSNQVNELEVMNQLATQSNVITMPVSKLLNAPGNENLKAFFFTPIKDKNALKGKRIAVLVADGFEEIELTGPVWYFKALGAQTLQDIVISR